MRRHHHPGLMVVNLRELAAVAQILRDEKCEKAAKVIDDALRELIDLRGAQPEPVEQFIAPVRH